MEVTLKTQILDAGGIRRTINRLAHELVENNKDLEKIALIGIRSRGEHLAYRLANLIKEIEGKEIPVGTLDITLYRDDLHGRLDQPKLKSTEILFDIKDKTLVLVDDVLYTGRTVRSALNALMDIGRPAQIELLVLADRGHRELPIKADFVGKNVPTSLSQEVKVLMTEIDGEDGIVLIEKEEDGK
ncbi:MAG TPA: bifunctional pyr operon transcriptional regulator/uracil phosphoribosyltransferase PyrR [Bacteroidota bacterium]|nr:bifunctional pyr operon transcriptional regulator/uracil phosphoribosyltransferase PyrR [Bacteroidota bacterium]